MEQLISQWTIATEDIKTEFRKNYGMNYVSDFIFQQMMPNLIFKNCGERRQKILYVLQNFPYGKYF